MVYVVLNSGKVIQYNNGGQICEENGSYVIRTNCKERWLIARIPMVNVERIEFNRPCKIMAAKFPSNKRIDKYEQ